MYLEIGRFLISGPALSNDKLGISNILNLHFIVYKKTCGFGSPGLFYGISTIRTAIYYLLQVE